MRTAVRRERRGQTLVEFALILPIFVLVLVGLFDLGRAVYAYNTISNAAREAARVGIVNQTTAGIQAEAVKQAVSLGISNGDVDVAFANSDLSSGPPCNVASPPNGCVLSVTVTYGYVPATPIIGSLIGTLELTSTARMPIERSYP